jgi:hypothetical protein
MYRAPHDTFVSTIERLEAELRELREAGLSPCLGTTRRTRERTLWATTAVSVIGALLAVAACGAARTRADDAERRFDAARVRLERKTQDLSECESFAYRELRRDTN